MKESEILCKNRVSSLDKKFVANIIFTTSRLHDFTTSRLHDFTTSRLHDFKH
ncbi:MAG: hypothetical protein IJT42_10000 [Treponema sp.]|nr:hypothetical protein [Treponema sp.]